MEVKMNKEIRNYQESMFMGLNLRQCIFSLLAIAVAVGIYFGLGKYVGQEMTGWLCILGAAPFAACGEQKYAGGRPEEVIEWKLLPIGCQRFGKEFLGKRRDRGPCPVYGR